MKQPPLISCALVDIGGVLLSNGWDRHARARAAEHFALDLSEFNERHGMSFEIYEIGKLTLDDYISRVIFYQKRAFTRAQFKDFMFAQSTQIPAMLEMITQLKQHFGLKMVALSNEGRELNDYRIRTFNLSAIFDVFVSSCFVKMRKPDPDIFQLAFDMVQVPAAGIVYIDNTVLFTDIAQGMGINCIHHQNYASTCAQLTALGLALPVSAI